MTWAEFDRRADGLARYLLDRGAVHQDKVAIYLHNCPEYLETSFACYKAGLVPVNTNYRYVEDELAYLWDNADALAVVFHGTFADRQRRIRGLLFLRQVRRFPTARISTIDRVFALAHNLATTDQALLHKVNLAGIVQAL